MFTVAPLETVKYTRAVMAIKSFFMNLFLKVELFYNIISTFSLNLHKSTSLLLPELSSIVFFADEYCAKKLRKKDSKVVTIRKQYLHNDPVLKPPIHKQRYSCVILVDLSFFFSILL